MQLIYTNFISKLKTYQIKYPVYLNLCVNGQKTFLMTYKHHQSTEA